MLTKPQVKQHRYGLQFRPAEAGTVPPIPFTVEPALTGDASHLTRHGVLVVGRPLSSKEIKQYELSVIADDDMEEETAILVALDLKNFADDLVRKSQADFNEAVLGGLKRVCRYPIYFADMPRFYKMVRSRFDAALDNARRASGSRATGEIFLPEMAPTPWRVAENHEFGHHIVDANGEHVPLTADTLLVLVAAVNAAR